MRNGFPLVEIHRHLDGNLRLATVLELGRRHGLELPGDTEEALRPHVEVQGVEPDLLGFLAKFDVLRRVMVDLSAVRRIARENVEDAHREGIDYIELRFSPWFMAEVHGLDALAVGHAVADGVEEAVAALPPLPHPRARLIGILSRNYGTEIAFRELDVALALRDRGLVALDLAGDEANYPGELFVEHFRRARDAGLEVTVHAGEAAGPDSVRQALDPVEGLGASRIGHGVRSIEDPGLVDLLARRGIFLEVCPTSNVQTSTVASYAEHPLGKFLERGVRATLNTDDPSISGIDLAHEYRVARDELGLGDDDLARLQKNAVDAAFLTPDERKALLAHRPTGDSP
jgi:adenosine deaminase